MMWGLFGKGLAEFFDAFVERDGGFVAQVGRAGPHPAHRRPKLGAERRGGALLQDP